MKKMHFGLVPNLGLFLLLFFTTTVLEAEGTYLAEPSSQSQEDLDRQKALVAGSDLEREKNWGEAIQHYESTLERYPKDRVFHQRLLISRLHFDVQRRLADSSYLATIRRTGTLQALDLYSEILENLQFNYVERVRWEKVLLYGTASLEVALSNEDFIALWLPNVSREKTEAFRQSLHHRLADRNNRTRFDLRSTVAYAVTLAERELGLSASAAVFEFVCGAVCTLDPYTRFLTSNQLDESFSNIKGNFVGLGIELNPTKDRLRIVKVIPNGPADRAGMRAGDAIVRVDQARTDQVKPDRVADLLRGPEHSVVSLTLVSPNGVSRDLKVRRLRVDVPSIEGVHILDRENGIGYLRLTNFQKTTLKELDQAYWKLSNQGMRQLIIDVRGNPGGLLEAAVNISDRFLSSGKIVQTRGRNKRENYDYTAHSTNTWSVPLFVLTDKDSASASEIFAGAISDNHRGTLVGETTYGKGSVQGLFRMRSAGVGLCLTTAKFYSPNDQPISGQGIQPTVEQETRYVVARVDDQGHLGTIEKDDVVQRAVQMARKNNTRIQSRASARGLHIAK